MNRLCLQYAVFIAAFHHLARIEGRQPDVALIIYEYACDVRFVGSAFPGSPAESTSFTSWLSML